MTELAPLVLAGLLVAFSISALLVKRLLWSLILLFYSSLLLGGILFWYGADYAGLFHIVTFAGAVSVMFMVIIMIVGQDPPERRSLRPATVTGIVLALLGSIPFMVMLGRLTPIQNRIDEVAIINGSVDDLGFLWNFRSWDMVFLLLPISAAILVVVNLFSKEDEVE